MNFIKYKTFYEIKSIDSTTSWLDAMYEVVVNKRD